jgi:hypothetical protein
LPVADGARDANHDRQENQQIGDDQNDSHSGPDFTSQRIASARATLW